MAISSCRKLHFQVDESQTTRQWVFEISQPPANSPFQNGAFAEGGVEGPRRIILLRGVRKLKKSNKNLTVNVLLRGAWAGQRPGSVPVAHERHLEVNEKIVNLKFFVTTSRRGPRR